MKIPHQNLIGVHYYDRSDISFKLYQLACNGRSQEATNKIVEKIGEALHQSKYRFDDFDFITHGDGECSRRIVGGIDTEFLRLADIPKVDLGNRRVLIVAGTENEAMLTYARLLTSFPLKIVVLCFLKNKR